MEIWDEIIKAFQGIPVFGKILSILILIFAINELINKYTVEKLNPLKKLIEFIPKLVQKRLVQKRKKYYTVLGTKEYLEWQTLVLSKIYDEFNFIIVLDWKYPTFCFPSKSVCKYPFKEVLDKNELDVNIDNYKISSKLQKEYKKIVGTTIRRPLLKGYMLNKLVVDEDNKVGSILAKVGTYEQNVYTSHILEYELYRLYLSKAKDISKLKSTELLKLLPLRNNIHKGCTQIEVLSSGANRYSLLGVQMFVMFLDHDDNSYKVLVIKRSEDVAQKPNFFQFIPSGGFEIFQNFDDEFVLRNNFSLRLSLFRELLEEAFGEEEFIHNDKGVPEESILSHDKIIYLTELLKINKAHFEFLGSVNDVVSLRHLLTFVLRVDDIAFSKQIFLPNHESKSIQLFKLDDLQQRIEKGKICNDSAGLLHLVMKNHLFTEVMSK